MFFRIKRKKNEDNNTCSNRIVTISREYASGGRELGKMLAKKLGYAYYDKEIIDIIANETNLSQEYINGVLENGIAPFAFQFDVTGSTYLNSQKMQIDVLLKTQKVICDIAKKENAVIVGRCANAILCDFHKVDLFVYADMEEKIKRYKEKIVELDENEDAYNMTEKQIENKISSIDSKRDEYHKFVAGRNWRDMRNYDLCINTTRVNLDGIADELAKIITRYFEGGKRKWKLDFLNILHIRN